MPDSPRRLLSVPGWVVLALFVVGVVMSTFVPGNIYRGWFALAAFILSLSFVLEYSRRNWRATFAGRASMLSMSITVIYTLNVVLILWWPKSGSLSHPYGYPYWEDTTEIIYLLLALAALYKLMVLMQAGRQTGEDRDPTAEVSD